MGLEVRIMRIGSYPVYYYQNQFNIKKMDKDLSQQKEILKGQMARVADSDTLSEAEKAKRLEKFDGLLKSLDEKLQTGSLENPYISDRPKVSKEDIPLAIGLQGDRGIKKGKPLINLLRGVREDFSEQISKIEVHEREESLTELLKKVEADMAQFKSGAAFKKFPGILRSDSVDRVFSFDEIDKKEMKKDKESNNRLRAKMSTYRYFDVRNVEKMIPNIRNPKVKYRSLDLTL